jgi:hypothetical protein
MALTIDGSDPSGDLGDLLDDKLDVATAVSDYLPIAGGKVLQVVRATDATQRSTTSGSFVDVTGMTVTITPQKSTSVILLITSAYTFSNSSGGMRITDSSNNAISGAEEMRFINCPSTVIGYATPATTSPVTYKTQFYSVSAGTTIFQNGINTGQMYAIEVSA